MKLEREGIELEYGGRLVYRYRMEFGVVSIPRCITSHTYNAVKYKQK